MKSDSSSSPRPPDCFILNDGSRQFASFLEDCLWRSLRAHLLKLDGLVETDYLSDEVTEMWLDFDYQRHQFTINTQFGEYWFSVADPHCPDPLLMKIIQHVSDLPLIHC